jgi:hypothetical protein
MDHKVFAIALTTFSGNPSRFRVIASTADAAEFLLCNWPGQEDEDWYNAIRKCNSALNGTSTPNEARTAFVAAAKGAGVLFNADISLP